MRKSRLRQGILLAALVLPGPPSQVLAQQNVSSAIAELRAIIAQQQQQISAQARTLDVLQQRLAALAKASEGQSPGSSHRSPATRITSPPTTDAALPRQTVASGDERISLALSGQVNRGVLYARDGTRGEVFHVDNDHSSTRFRLVGKGRLSDDVTLGSVIEVQMESNSTASVSQDDNENGVGGTSFTERKLEVFVDSTRFGTLWLGQGQTASDDSAQVDLSGTTVIAYSNSPDEMSGGIKFYDSADRRFGPTVGSVFSNFDGLSRDDRIRYDSPKLGGFGLSASHVSGGAFDVALRHAAKYGAVKAAGAIAYAEPSGISGTVEDRLSGSVSLRHDVGLNATLAAGRDRPEAGGSDPHYLYGKLGYAADIFEIGETAFAVDLARAENVERDGDVATALGFGAVQNLGDYGTQLYLGIRNHALDRVGEDFDDVLTTLVGARVKF